MAVAVVATIRAVLVAVAVAIGVAIGVGVRRWNGERHEPLHLTKKVQVSNGGGLSSLTVPLTVPLLVVLTARGGALFAAAWWWWWWWWFSGRNDGEAGWWG